MSSVPLSLMYRSDQHIPQLFDTLRELFMQEELCDTVLSVGSCHIKAHRAVLAAFSPYFRTALRQDSISFSRGFMVHVLPNLNEDIVKLLINFCYAGEIVVDSQSAEDMLIAARCLQVQEVEKLCVTFLAAQHSLKTETSPMRPAAQRPCSIFTRGVPPGHASPTQNVHRGRNSNESNQSEPMAANSSPTVQSTSVSSGHGASSPQDSADVEVISIKSEPLEVSDESGPDHDVIQTEMFGKFVPKYGIHRGVRHSSIHSPLQLSPGNPNLFLSPSLLTMARPGLLVPHPILAGQVSHSPVASHAIASEMVASQSMSSQMGISQSAKSRSTPSQSIKSQLLSSQSHTEQEAFADQSSPSQHIASPPVSVHQCVQCNEILSSQEALKAHEVLHRQPPRELTAKPRRLYSNASFRSDHQEGSKNFMCSTCGKCFKNLQALKFHRYNHVLRYSCSFCGKRFSRSFNMQRHRKTHFKERIWQSMVGVSEGFEASDMRLAENLASDMELVEQSEEPSEDIPEDEESISQPVDEHEEDASSVTDAEPSESTYPLEVYQNMASDESS